MASSNGNGHPDLTPYYPLVHEYLRRFKCRDASAEDLTQQTYFRAYQGLERGSVPRDTRAWMLAIARHVGYSQIRTDQRYRGLTLDDKIEAALYDESVHEPVDSVISDEDRVRVRQAIDSLTREEQLFVYAWHAPDRHLFDPASQFGLSPGLAKVHAYRLRKKLKRLLEDDE
jgi:RNA polymerase sigma-70 factor (ECF subfamily)